MPVDKDGGSRHYRGPELPPTPPPMPLAQAMPPAEELLPPSPPADDPLSDAFLQWCQRARLQGASFTSEDLFRAFEAGIAYAEERALMKARGVKARVAEELEGTVESRTIVAALTFFREQVLAHSPEEVRTGEWMSTADVDRLIQAITEDGRRRAVGREQ